MPKTTATKRSGGVRARAILATGLALGLGASLSLAAWTQSDIASATFSAAHFEVLTSSGGVQAQSHPTAPGLSVKLNPDRVYFPGEFHYGTVDVATSPSTTVGATLKLYDHKIAMGTAFPGVSAQNKNRDIRNYVQYRMVTVSSSTTCDASQFASTIPTSHWLTDVSGRVTYGQEPVRVGNSIHLDPSGANPQRLCIQVILASSIPNYAQGLSVDYQWTFKATSTTP